MNKFSDKLMAKIKKEKIKHIPSWHFVLKNMVFWSLFAVSVLVGAMTFSVIIFAFSYDELEILPYVQYHLDLLMQILPVFWIFTLTILLLVSIIFVKKTKTGYRYSSIKIVGLSFLISLLLGGTIHVLGMSEKIEKTLAKNIPQIGSIGEHRAGRWVMPESGFLAGIVVEKKSEYIVLEDVNRKSWKIYNADRVQKGDLIRVVGVMKNRDEFIAEKVLPENERMNMFLEKHHKGCMMGDDENCPIAPVDSRPRGANRLNF